MGIPIYLLLSNVYFSAQILMILFSSNLSVHIFVQEYFFWSAYRDKFWQGSMSVDKSWMRMSRATAEWQKGLQEFLNFAFQDDKPGDNAPCPCRRCLNVVHKTRSEVQSDLLRNGFDESYIQWVYHGEDSDDDNVTGRFRRT